MTALGLYLAKRTVNKAEVSRRTGISKSRLTQLTANDSAKLRADELYRAINADPGEMFKELFAGLGLMGGKDGN